MQALVFGVDLLSVSCSGIIFKPVQPLGEHTFKSVHPQFFKIFEFLFDLFVAITLFGYDDV